MKVPFNINLSGKTAVVTGGSGTLCSAMAYGLAVCGAKVAIIGRNKEKLASVSEKLTKDALDEYNKNQPTYRRITGLVVRKNPFIRNTTKKIRRQDVLIDEPLE